MGYTGAAMRESPWAQYILPTQVADNLYFLGSRQIGVWIVKTSEGLILFDSYWADQVRPAIVEAMRVMGLDPTQIKYVIVGHGHADHYGGSAYLQFTFGAKIVMMAKDWDFVEKAAVRPDSAPKPTRDVVVNDGDTITLGDTTVSMVETPGHTPGGIGAVFPVKDRGQTHWVGWWGSNIYYGELPVPEMTSYIASIDRMMALADRKGVDMEITNHIHSDNSYPKLVASQSRAAGQANPFIVGKANYQRYLGVLKECAEASLDREKARISRGDPLPDWRRNIFGR